MFWSATPLGTIHAIPPNPCRFLSLVVGSTNYTIDFRRAGCECSDDSWSQPLSPPLDKPIGDA
jgi:hypothetical protein